MSESIPTETSPFHRGEREIQERLGVREQVEEIGRRFILDRMPDEHRAFYQRLPFILAGTVDAQGRPWASLLPGEPGFAHSPDPYTLSIETRPLYGDPLNENLREGADIGLLGIEFASRRRNRLNGKMQDVHSGGFQVKVSQSFGNCPQYIQARDLDLRPAIKPVEEPRPVERLNQLRNIERKLIGRADTFFISTQYADGDDGPSNGIDVSHRGGKPGFVRVEGGTSLVFPDFSGNRHFNTLGNILLNERTGLLFMDFDAGDILYLTGRAEIIWSGETLEAFKGAERLIRFHVDEGVRVNQSLPFGWTFQESSPVNELTGSWEEVDETLRARSEGNTYREFRVTRIERESETISSFYLQPVTGEAVACYEPGQFLPLEVPQPDANEPVRRTYSLSNAPNSVEYRLSIKREPPPHPDLPAGISSGHFHDHVTLGTVLRAMNPRGTFVLDTKSTRPVVLLSAGVGLTPMISMLDHLVRREGSCGCTRSVWFIHGARNGTEHAFGRHVRDVAECCPLVQVHVRYSQPRPGDVPGRDFDSVGRVDLNLLKQLLPLDDYDFYLCGPHSFMESIHSGLKLLNIADMRIHYEFFGPAAALGRDASGVAGEEADAQPTEVRFGRSNKVSIWDASRGTLLDLAEAEGLRPAYSCRSGVCQTCATRIVSGQVSYTQPPMTAPPEGHALICCAVPHRESASGEEESLVLDL